jgi:hypothetical protein
LCPPPTLSAPAYARRSSHDADAESETLRAPRAPADSPRCYGALAPRLFRIGVHIPVAGTMLPPIGWSCPDASKRPPRSPVNSGATGARMLPLSTQDGAVKSRWSRSVVKHATYREESTKASPKRQDPMTPKAGSVGAKPLAQTVRLRTLPSLPKGWIGAGDALLARSGAPPSDWAAAARQHGTRPRGREQSMFTKRLRQQCGPKRGALQPVSSAATLIRSAGASSRTSDSPPPRPAPDHVENQGLR